MPAVAGEACQLEQSVATHRVEDSSSICGASQRTAERETTAGGANDDEERATTASMVRLERGLGRIT